MFNILAVIFKALSYETAEKVSINPWMSFPEFCCTAKATGNIFDFVNKVITFNNVMDIILIRLCV